MTMYTDGKKQDFSSSTHDNAIWAELSKMARYGVGLYQGQKNYRDAITLLQIGMLFAATEDELMVYTAQYTKLLNTQGHTAIYQVGSDVDIRIAVNLESFLHRVQCKSHRRLDKNSITAEQFLTAIKSEIFSTQAVNEYSEKLLKRLQATLIIKFKFLTHSIDYRDDEIEITTIACTKELEKVHEKLLDTLRPFISWRKYVKGDVYGCVVKVADAINPLEISNDKEVVTA